MAFPNGRRVAIVAGVRTPFGKAGRSEGRSRDGAGPPRRARAARADRSRSREGRRGHLRPGGPLGARAQHRARSEPPAAVPQGHPGLLRSTAPAPPRTRPSPTPPTRSRSVTPTSSSPAASNRSPTSRSSHSRRFSRHPGRRPARPEALGARLAAFARIRPRDLVPVTPAIAEPSTGESMGQSAEKMAKENDITREAQDRLALRSHQRAAAGTADGRLTAEIAPWCLGEPRLDEVVAGDNGIRTDTSLEAAGQAQAGVRPPLRHVTAGNSSPLTDGAAAVLLMAEDKARALGYEPLAYIRSYAVAAVDPGWQLLHGAGLRRAPGRSSAPASPGATSAWSRSTRPSPRRCCRNVQAWGFGLGRALGSGTGGRGRLGRINVMGGSIAIGHPFGATGGTARDHARQRDAAARRAVRADLDLRAGRHGRRPMVLERR